MERANEHIGVSAATKGLLRESTSDDEEPFFAYNEAVPTV
jgi:hypothetical protein